MRHSWESDWELGTPSHCAARRRYSEHRRVRWEELSICLHLQMRRGRSSWRVCRVVGYDGGQSGGEGKSRVVGSRYGHSAWK